MASTIHDLQLELKALMAFYLKTSSFENKAKRQMHRNSVLKKEPLGKSLWSLVDFVANKSAKHTIKNDNWQHKTMIIRNSITIVASEKDLTEIRNMHYSQDTIHDRFDIQHAIQFFRRHT